MMKISVLYFAYFRDKTGLKREEIELPEGTTVGALKAHLGMIHETILEYLSTAIFAVNREFAFPEDVLHEGDEVAVFPPVSGGSESFPTYIKITEDSLDLNEVVTSLTRLTTGAACVFTGTVRGKTTRGDPHETTYLQYDAYRPMAEEKLRQVADEIRERWPDVEGIAIIQRIGRMDPGTPTVLVACTSGHRDMGVFEAARYGIDRLKEIVPVWKKDVGPTGEQWVEGSYSPSEKDRKE